MADQAPDQQHKRHRKGNSADEAASSSYQEANTRKRQKHNGEGGPKSAEFYKALEEELNAKSFDPVATDKSDIEEELRSGSSILVLESTPSRRSYCRALLCLGHKLTGIINIESDYRFNLRDLTGKRSGDLSHYLQPNRYYHVTCLEHILNLRSLLEPNHIKMEGGTSTYNILGTAVSRTSSFHPMIEDWFTNNGCAFDVEEYDRWDKAYDNWVGESSDREMNHQLGGCRKGECTCQPIPQKPKKADYFSAERTPRLLTEVLASVAKVHQIDRLPKAFLSVVKE